MRRKDAFSLDADVLDGVGGLQDQQQRQAVKPARDWLAGRAPGSRATIS
jgi:hypothetical protein